MALPESKFSIQFSKTMFIFVWEFGNRRLESVIWRVASWIVLLTELYMLVK